MTQIGTNRSARRAAALLLAACAWSGVVACGKKGPPLPPFVRLPAAVQQPSASRLARDVYFTFTVPTTNVDRSTPVDIEYVDVYAYTGPTAPPSGSFVQRGTRIARVPVSPVTPVPDSAGPASSDAVAPGAVVTVLDTLENVESGQHRYYQAIPFSTRARPGSQHAPVDVLLAVAPAPPAAPQLAVTAESVVTVAWPATPPPASTPAPRMNVYRVPPGNAVPAPVWRATRPRPLNMAPLNSATFADTVMVGSEVCYVLRSVVGEGAMAVEGDASPATCVTPLDRFPPAAPAQLVATATSGAINLLWEANSEADLAGYLVLRGAPGDARLQPLTTMPVRETRFSDAAVVAGMRYVYAVVAVDSAMPTPNVSPESMRVEEAAQ